MKSGFAAGVIETAFRADELALSPVRECSTVDTILPAMILAVNALVEFTLIGSCGVLVVVHARKVINSPSDVKMSSAEDETPPTRQVGGARCRPPSQPTPC